MPIEIKELVIRAIVDPEGGGTSAALPEEDRRQLVADCVEQVLDILRRREER